VKSDKELAEHFLKKGIDTTLPIVNSCGSGVTASVNDLGLRIIGAENSIIYDGSWTEYGSIEEPDFSNTDWDTAIPDIMQKINKKRLDRAQ